MDSREEAEGAGAAAEVHDPQMLSHRLALLGRLQQHQPQIPPAYRYALGGAEMERWAMKRRIVGDLIYTAALTHRNAVIARKRPLGKCQPLCLMVCRKKSLQSDCPVRARIYPCASATLTRNSMEALTGDLCQRFPSRRIVNAACLLGRQRHA